MCCHGSITGTAQPPAGVGVACGGRVSCSGALMSGARRVGVGDGSGVGVRRPVRGSPQAVSSSISSSKNGSNLGIVYDLRFTIYDLRFTIYDLRFAIYDLRFTICDLRFAICDLRFAICD
jgi:hypothetical protein